jgi:hypothetical protein
MKNFVLFVAFLIVSFGTCAQTPTGLPDSPAPKVDPCKGQKAGSLCNGRRYYPDLLKLDESDKTWAHAAKSPGMLFAGGLLVGATILDIESAQHCIHSGGCREGNPIMGQSRAQEYGVAMPITALVYYLSVREKQHGHGFSAFCVMYGGAVIHWMGFAHNRGNYRKL